MMKFSEFFRFIWKCPVDPIKELVPFSGRANWIRKKSRDALCVCSVRSEKRKKKARVVSLSTVFSTFIRRDDDDACVLFTLYYSFSRPFPPHKRTRAKGIIFYLFFFLVGIVGGKRQIAYVSSRTTTNRTNSSRLDLMHIRVSCCL